MDNKFNPELKRKYVGIKVKGLDHYLWFESTKVSFEEEYFTGKEGWGKGGNLTNISSKVSEINSIIHSDILHISH